MRTDTKARRRRSISTAERRAGDFVRGLIRSGRVSAVHDISDGGLLVAVAEMALAGGRGVALDAAPEGRPAHAVWFGEDQGRYLVAAASDEAARILQEAAKAGIRRSACGNGGRGCLETSRRSATFAQQLTYRA